MDIVSVVGKIIKQVLASHGKTDISKATSNTVIPQELPIDVAIDRSTSRSKNKRAVPVTSTSHPKNV